jgi:CRISPR-associated protein Cmr3
MWGLYFSVSEDSSDRPKAIRVKGTQEYFYPNIKGDPLAKVVRTDDGNGVKKFAQWHRIHGKGLVWASGLPSHLQKQLHLYRVFDEVNKLAIANHESILIVEGEGKVDLLLSMGIAATCAIGGAGKWRRYGYPNYLDDLMGSTVILVPDRDAKGMAHMEDIQKDFPDAQWLYPYSDSPFWHKLPEKGGLDIADWIEDFKLSKVQILDAVGNIPKAIGSNTKKQEIPQEVPNAEDNNDQEDKDILLSETHTLLSWLKESIAIDSLIPSLANSFTMVARDFNIPEVVLVSALLPIAASLLKVGTKIEIAAATEFYPPPILWTGIIAESGATKSPIFKILTKPLKVLQAEAEEEFKAKLKEYDELLQKYEASKDKRVKPEKPTPRNYFFQDFTTEGLALSLEGATHGTMIAVDELAEMLAGFNQYKGGKGNDRQKWLTIYDSGGMKVDRCSGRRMFLTHTPVSILGTIQPDVLKQQMGDLYTVDGLWQRFLWVNLPVTRLPAPGDGVKCYISEMLLAIYRRLENLPAIAYSISPEARKVWSGWHDWCETQKLAQAHPSIRTLFPKARERAARIALA